MCVRRWALANTLSETCPMSGRLAVRLGGNRAQCWTPFPEKHTHASSYAHVMESIFYSTLPSRIIAVSKSKDSLSWPFWLGFQSTNCVPHCVEVKGIILFDVENIANVLSLFTELNNKIRINRVFCISSLLEKAFELSGIVMYQVTWRWMEWINPLDQLTVTNNWSRHMYQYQTNTNQNSEMRFYFSIVNNIS